MSRKRTKANVRKVHRTRRLVRHGGMFKAMGAYVSKVKRQVTQGVKDMKDGATDIMNNMDTHQVQPTN